VIKLKPKKGDPYLVVWRDHFTEESAVSEDYIITSLGFFVREYKGFYTFARSHHDGEYDTVVSIIKSQVLSIKELS
jgi:hypothetical protein